MDVLSGLIAALSTIVGGGGGGSVHAAQLTVRQQLIIRVPRRTSPAKLTEWKAKRASRCVTMAAIAGAAVVKADAVDFILRGGRRVRAEFDASCPALDYYTGFYVLPTADGRMCADRDAVHDRSGNECAITRFRTLVQRRSAAR